jgi:hypothetical protein
MNVNKNGGGENMIKYDDMFKNDPIHQKAQENLKLFLEWEKLMTELASEYGLTFEDAMERIGHYTLDTIDELTYEKFHELMSASK